MFTGASNPNIVSHKQNRNEHLKRLIKRIRYAALPLAEGTVDFSLKPCIPIDGSDSERR